MSTTSLYNKLYKDKSYNDKTPFKIEFVKTWAEINELKTLIDIGCGRCHYMKEIDNVTGLEPSTYACEHDLKGLDVINSDILGLNTGRTWDGLYCMDVLEHIPYEEIDDVLRVLSELAPKAIFGIANHSDVQDGVELHAIQQPAEWWSIMLRKHYNKVQLTYEPLRYFVFECSQ